MKTNPDDGAFSPHSRTEKYGENIAQTLPIGLTKREYFAAMAMQGSCASESGEWNYQNGEIAKLACARADALIDALNVKQKATT